MDLTGTAREFFFEFAQRHLLTIEVIKSEEVELLTRIPRQEGLSFDIDLAFYVDVIFVVAGEHTGERYIIDHDVPAAMESLLPIIEGLVNGDCRVVEVRQRGRIWKTAIEKCSQGRWSAVSTRYHTFLGFHWPFIERQITYKSNTRSNSHPTHSPLP